MQARYAYFTYVTPTPLVVAERRHFPSYVSHSRFMNTYDRLKRDVASIFEKRDPPTVWQLGQN